LKKGPRDPLLSEGSSLKGNAGLAAAQAFKDLNEKESTFIFIYNVGYL